MSNHAFITCPKNIDIEKVKVVLEDVSARRFNNFVHFEYGNGWAAAYLEGEDPPIFEIFMSSKKKLTMPHPNGDFTYWIWISTKHELAKALKGWITDEGTPGRNRGRPEKYPTFRSWIEVLYKDKNAQDFFGQLSLRHLPKKVRTWASKS